MQRFCDPRTGEQVFTVELHATAGELAQVFNAIADDAALDHVSLQLSHELDAITTHPGQLVLSVR